MFCNSLTKVSGYNIDIGIIPTLSMKMETLTYETDSEPAYNWLIALSEMLESDSSWQLLYDPVKMKYTLNLL